MQEFTTAVARTEGQDDGSSRDHQFKLDGVVLTARRPSDTRLAMFAAGTASRASTGALVREFVDFIEVVMSPDDSVDDPERYEPGEIVSSRDYLRERLMNEDDPFGLADCKDLLLHLLEVWSGRPTGSSSGSSAGRRATGRRSTVRG